jgi:hypothetical protein
MIAVDREYRAVRHQPAGRAVEGVPGGVRPVAPVSAPGAPRARRLGIDDSRCRIPPHHLGVGQHDQRVGSVFLGRAAQQQLAGHQLHSRHATQAPRRALEPQPVAQQRTSPRACAYRNPAVRRPGHTLHAPAGGQLMLTEPARYRRYPYFEHRPAARWLITGRNARHAPRSIRSEAARTASMLIGSGADQIALRAEVDRICMMCGGRRPRIVRRVPPGA